tara:strand:+ start:156 stop:347 length:192 start_codon:yes stop_codon:yes gene_type:complete
MSQKYILGKLNKDKSSYNLKDWEEVPDEDLWQDGEIKYPEIKDIIYHQVIKQGVWKIIRRKDG